MFNDLETRIAGKRIVVLKWDAVPVLDAGGLDAFQRFVNKLPEGCELRVSNLEFQPLRTLARAGVKPLPGRLSFYPIVRPRWLTCDHPAAGPCACRIRIRSPAAASSAPPASSVPFIKCGSCSIARRNFCNVCGRVPA